MIARMLKADPAERIGLDAAESMLKGAANAAESAAVETYLVPAGDLI